MTEDVLSWEPTLFDDPDDAVPARINTDAFAATQRHELDANSWILHLPGFLEVHHALLATLRTAPAWEQRERWMFNRMVQEPRLTAEYRDLTGAPNLLRDIATTLSAQYGVDYDRIWMNWYRDNNDGTGWHADRPANKQDQAIIPVLSLGATRPFLIRPAHGR